MNSLCYAHENGRDKIQHLDGHANSYEEKHEGRYAAAGDFRRSTPGSLSIHLRSLKFGHQAWTISVPAILICARKSYNLEGLGTVESLTRIRGMLGGTSSNRRCGHQASLASLHAQIVEGLSYTHEFAIVHR